MIGKKIKELIRGREFNAENCRKHQRSELERQASLVIDDIKTIINFKVSNTNEKAIIYSLPDRESKVLDIVEEYFSKRGFKVFITNFVELDDAEFLVISWASNMTVPEYT